MSEKHFILPKFREYRCIVQEVEAKNQSNDKYKQNLRMTKLLKCIFHFFPVPYGGFGVIRWGNPKKIIFKTGLK